MRSYEDQLRQEVLLNIERLQASGQPRLCRAGTRHIGTGRVFLSRGFMACLRSTVADAAMHATAATLPSPTAASAMQAGQIDDEDVAAEVAELQVAVLACMRGNAGCAARLVCSLSLRCTTTGLLGTCCGFGNFEPP